jgi:hypothetical protein
MPVSVDMLDGAAIDHAVLHLEDHEIARWHLRQLAVVEVFVTLVFDGDRAERLVLVQRDRIRLTTEIAAGLDLLRRDIDDPQAARRLGLALGGIDRDQCLADAEVTDVGSPSIISAPPAFGALASVISTKPIAPSGLSL